MDGKKIAFVLVVAVLSLLGACKTVTPVITDDMTAPEFFQKAQEESDNYRWDNALVYYRAFLEKYPEDPINGIFANYEIAFILYKKQEYKESKKLFQEILESYKNLPNPLAVPQWAKVLSEKLIVKIDQKLEALLPTKNEPKLPEPQAMPPAQPQSPAK